jgi:RHS repeat-associated protein/uncharacterized protein (TIGR03382 family)
MASFRYDEANRRVYANIAGKETWELRGPGGELLAEVSGTGEVERAYVYLDGEPLAMVSLNPGKALRSPSTPLGCTSTGGLSGSMLALLAMVLILRRRKLAGMPQGAALTVLVLLLTGCEPTQPSPLPDPAPGAAPGEVFYFHNDRLGTPVRLTNERGVTVWRADYRPFGEVQRLETDVDGDGVHIEQPLRFPGQYDDSMSALILAQGPYYNWNRHYEPATGRDLSPEPMLQDPTYVTSMAQEGMSAPTYAYGNNNPLHYIDRDGREPGAVTVPGVGPVPWPLVPLVLPVACTFNFSDPLCRAIRPGGGPGTPPESEQICRMGAATAAAAASVNRLTFCLGEAAKAMAFCLLNPTRSIAQCSYAWDLRFAACMGYPLPTYPPTIH